MKVKLPKFKRLTIQKPKRKQIFLGLITASIFVLAGYLSFYSYNYITTLQQDFTKLQKEKETNLDELERIGQELEELKNRDEYKINKELNENIKNVEITYNTAVSVYEDLLQLKESTDKTEKLNELFTEALVLLSELNYTTASAKLTSLRTEIKSEQEKIAESFKIPETVPVQNTPPGTGYNRQQVQTDVGTFLVSIIAADYSTTRVIVDTAADSDCANDCPVLPLATYVSRNGAFAGVNGSYFCPATYPSCTGKTNTFDTLLMNKNKTYFNSENNVYSNNPAVIFGGGYIRFVTAASQWGRDTGIDSMISNYPLLVFNSNVSFGGDDDPKKGSKGNRSFVANKENNVYIGVVHNATVAESARVMKTLGMENALNLDNGGSTALWYGGYKVGPGRNLPNVVLFVRK